MLKVLTTEAFADWFAALDDTSAEDVATALDVIEQLGPAKAPPASRESLLWYEHPSVSRFVAAGSFACDLESWGTFRDYAKRILERLESPRFGARLSGLSQEQAARALGAIKRIRRATDPRMRWSLRLMTSDPSLKISCEDACAELRGWYFEALEAAGFKVEDVPVHSRALRELCRRIPEPAFRLLYGVQVERETALIALGERLDRAFYGDAVRRAERMWRAFLDGDLRAEPARLH